MRHVASGFAPSLAALAFVGLGAPGAEACGWLWACADRAEAHRKAPHAYGYRSPPRAYRRYRRRGWAYGYTSPRRASGDPYAAWPSTSIPPSRRYLRTAPLVPDAGATGLTPPIATRQGLLQGGLPPRGPSLFGPQPAPGGTYGYYGAPAYGYRPPSYDTPPPNTPSWWKEPRRRRY